ncbi:transporter associated domain-containing protein [Roseibium aggregatum]|uniref:HlyC/CorC family transporter n=1 Tax=Roseibium aggregatum TaxID=187304 RepID=A0A926SA43_9HYPH|nr:hemolysin family protein [Roseibium aggregatum]MBD1548259.1 HlyC/CorC family transporter [Roseibium aggregatum]
MTASDARSPETSPAPFESAAKQDAEDPQQSGPPKKAAIWDTVRRMFGVRRPTGSLRENLEDELAREGSGDTAFSPEERMLLGNILRLRELRVDDVMIPRADIDAVESSSSLSRVMELFEESSHSRMPVYEETLDDPRGMIHIKDLMAFIAARAVVNDDKPETSGEDGENGEDAPPRGHNLRELDLSQVDLSGSLKEAGLVRELLFVPPSMPATDLMAKMQADRIQMALVIDEYGGTDGLVSLEDLVEEVVGDIEDEHDEDEEAMLAETGDGGWIADPRLPLEDLDQTLGTQFATGEISEDVDTLGGLLFVSIGRVPVRGELLAAPGLPGYEFEVLDADPRRIKRLRIRRRKLDGRLPEQRRRVKKADAPTGAGQPAADE